MSEEMKGEFENMCNLSQAIEDKGIAKGIDIGRAEGIDIGRAEGIDIGRAEGIDIGRAEGIDIGRAEGMKKGKFKERLANIQNLMDSVKWPAEQAMDALKISQEERSQYLPKLKYLN